MESRWSDAEAKRAVAHYAERGVGEDLALRTYSARLLGSDWRLVLHGGGNTSVKTKMRDVYGDEVRVLCVKGSGWDLATIEPEGHPAVRLEPLLRLRSLEKLTDEDMVSVQRANLLDSAAPNPSVETLLHAFLPHKFVDHTHSVAAVSIADQPEAEEICRRIYGERIACVPYVLPGFGLAKAAASAFEANPHVEGLMLIKHGIFSFGETAREAYERMIELVTLAENHIAASAKPRAKHEPRAREKGPEKAELFPILRGALRRGGTGQSGRATGFSTAAKELRSKPSWPMRSSHPARCVARRRPITSSASRDKPLMLAPPMRSALDAWEEGATQAVRDYVGAYEAYFARQNQRVGGIKKALDPMPRVIIVPGIGVSRTWARTRQTAKVAGDLFEAAMGSILGAEAIGRFEPIGEDDQFDMEYWSLEQAKLGKSTPKRLAAPCRHRDRRSGGDRGRDREAPSRARAPRSQSSTSMEKGPPRSRNRSVQIRSGLPAT